jgi:hypothetical protein
VIKVNEAKALFQSAGRPLYAYIESALKMG